jgi:ApaG protein
MSQQHSYKKTTHDVCVSVIPEYLEDQSAPEDGQFTWAYHVQIENVGNRTVQILARHWKITNILGESHEVIGDGLVGKQPVLGPGDVFEYTSGTPLTTPSGFMSGTFQAVAEGGEILNLEVPDFSLDSPSARRALH